MKKKQGISLIVLVITIIVMIILAAAVVFSLSNSGIINKANDAVEKSNLKEVEQLASIAWAEEFMDGKRGDTLKTAVLARLRDYTEIYDITVDDSGVKVSLKGKKGKNEYGFYFDEPYSYIDDEYNKTTFIFHEDGSANMYVNNWFDEEAPAGSMVYSSNKISMGGNEGEVNSDGTEIYFALMGETISLEKAPVFKELELNEYGFYFEHPYLCEENVSECSSYSILQVSTDYVDMQEVQNYIGSDLKTYVVFHEDTSVDFYAGTRLIQSVPAGFVSYSEGQIDLSEINLGRVTVLDEGTYMESSSLKMGLGYEFGDYVYYIDNIYNTGGWNIEVKYKMEEEYDAIPEAISGMDITILEFSFANCRKMKRAPQIPSTVVTASSTYESCENLLEITIPKTLTKIIHGGFGNIINIYVEEGNPVYHVKDNCLIETATNRLVVGCATSKVPNYVTSIGQSAFCLVTNLESIVLPSSVKTIEEYAFKYCDNLKSVVIPASVTTIDSQAFYFCKSLGELIFESPSQLTTLGMEVFVGCYALNSVVLPSSLTTTGWYAWQYCENLTTVTIPINITKIDYHSFNNCVKLTRINYEGTIAQWKNISSKESWNYKTPEYTVYCSDGTITKSGIITYN